MMDKMQTVLEEKDEEDEGERLSLTKGYQAISECPLKLSATETKLTMNHEND